MIVYVLDTETTGLKGYPTDLVLEICINEVNLTKFNYKTKTEIGSNGLINIKLSYKTV